jgi:hypothetical protein
MAYNQPMALVSPPPAPLDVAGTFLEALLGGDFARLAGCLHRDARLRALTPGGRRDQEGAADVADQFATWFGGDRTVEPVAATVGEVGGRLHLRWRLRVRLEPDAAGWHVIEQDVFADCDDDRIRAIDLLCSGFREDDHD